MATCPSLSHEENLIEKARQDLEHEILQCNRAIIDKKIRLNSLTKIARLPPELLSEVFLQYRLGMTRDGMSTAYELQPFRWIRITHVCHHWRDVALRFPRLWSAIDLRRVEILEEMLARSKQAPLHVTAYKSFTPLESFKRILQEFQRMESVGLYLLESTYVQTAEFAPVSAPRLRSITLRNDNFHAISRSSLPALFNKCDMPALEKVEVSRYPISWSNAIFRPTLTHLVINGSIEGIPPLAETLGALQNMPSLKHIDLSSVLNQLPASTHAPPVVSRNIAIANLSYLRLSAPGLAGANFLDHLMFPSTAVIRLELTSIRDDSDLRAIAQSIVSKLTGATTTGDVQPFLSFAASHRYAVVQGLGHLLEGWTAVHPVHKLSSTYISPQVSIDLHCGLLTQALILELFHCTLPLSEVQSLHIRDVYTVTSSGGVWTALMGKMPNVSKLRVSGESIRALPTILQGRVDMGLARKGGRRRTQPVLRHLQTVSLHESMLRPSTEDMDDDELLAALKKAFTARNKSRTGVKELIIERCINMGKHDVDELKKIVKNVVWDGIEDWEDPEPDSEEEDEDEEGFYDYFPFDDLDGYGYPDPYDDFW